MITIPNIKLVVNPSVDDNSYKMRPLNGASTGDSTGDFNGASYRGLSHETGPIHSFSSEPNFGWLYASKENLLLSCSVLFHFLRHTLKGSAVAKIIGNNVKAVKKFASTVKMWVFEENVNGRKLTDIINNDHENVKYLPGYKLPENVVAIPSLKEAVKDADMLVFVIPHQFIHKICDEMIGHVAKKAIGITLIKGIDEGPEGLKLISDIIREKMGIDISVLMGANIANEVAAEKFCETTIGCKILENGFLFKELLQTPNFRITVVDDADTVELCGALKNIVAVGAGFCDGLRCGDNTKAAVIRLGLMEMIAFAKIFCKGQVSTATFLESCGVADLITTCYGGRNRRVAEAFVKTGKTIEELEQEMLNGQKLQGPQTSAEVYRILKQKGLTEKFPLFAAVYQICYEGRPVQEIISCLQSHPEHI
uniref:Glycerol-3-phosphate dehydrogenase n=1 Tax=Sphaerodactylus townsendi TaxID=933632 RepID=A0ACB8FVV9_9SAUR